MMQAGFKGTTSCTEAVEFFSWTRFIFSDVLLLFFFITGQVLRRLGWLPILFIYSPSFFSFLISVLFIHSPCQSSFGIPVNYFFHWQENCWKIDILVGIYMIWPINYLLLPGFFTWRCQLTPPLFFFTLHTVKCFNSASWNTLLSKCSLLHYFSDQTLSCIEISLN